MDFAGPDEVVITIAEYEALQKDSQRVTELRNRMDEYNMKRKLLRDANAGIEGTVGQTLRLRRVTLNGISVTLSKDWDG